MLEQNLDRSWRTRFDSLTSPDPLSNLETVATLSHPAMSPSQPSTPANDPKPTQSRVVQDASIFVGSLPSNIDHVELASMLSQHLSEHPQVQIIKVVRDSKGGTCAFIQCQDPDTAATLLTNLQSSTPRQFMGRHLRYEPARAFRTLLISYRSPKQYIRQGDVSKRATFLATEDNNYIDLELPTAMRIIRTPGTKQLSIFYNSDATVDRQSIGGPTLLLMPLLCDAESLMRIASVFGTIENFGAYTPEHEDGQLPTSFPAPHDSPRSSVMDPGCWEVKWAHRDDCVSALVTLRRVPHLTVTWAHQSTSTFRDHRRYYNTRPIFTGQPPHAWRTRGSSSGLCASSRFPPPNLSYPAFRDAESPSIVQHPSGAENAEPASPPSSSSNSWEQKTTAKPSSRAMSTSRQRALSLTHDRPQTSVPLTSRESTGNVSSTGWGSVNRVPWTDRVDSAEFRRSPSVFDSTFVSPPCFASPKTTSADDGQEIEIDLAPTPEYGASPSTPKTPGSVMLRTPTTSSHMGDFQSMSFKDYDSQGSLMHLPREKREDTIVDPTTIFVGGLDMFGPTAWDEAKVRALFSRYGGVEAVKVVRPTNKRSAFAFVKFDNTDSPARAIREEHNRTVDGRLIRVQLRDWTPYHRISWRPGRGKELDAQSSLVAGDEFQVYPSLPRPGIIDITAHMKSLRLKDAPTNHASLPSPVETHEPSETKDEPRILQPERSAQTTVDYASSSTNAIPTAQEQPEGERGEPAPPTTLIVSSSETSVAPAPVPPATYSLPTVPYYHQGWIPGYGPQFPYQVSFTGQPYPGYPFSQPLVPPVPRGSGSDGGGTPSNTPVPFGPPCGSFPAFTPYPALPLGHPGPEPIPSGPGHMAATNNPVNPHMQAPVIPTGFIQGDQGMLVPIYPPDVLNQYMTGNPDQQAQVLTNPSGSTEGQPTVAWHPYPPPVNQQAVFFHPYINSPLPPPVSHQMGNHGWIPGHGWLGAPPQLGHTQGVPGRRFSSSSAGGPATVMMGSSFDRNLPPRRQHRREFQAQYHKNNFYRGSAGRPPKSSFNSPRFPPNVPPTSALHNAPHGDTFMDGNW
ncbi:hypothetical protein PAXRUDRAFT_7769 [Paxillus rubicundulus Ve08.2h10]|uniref:RRM domain-containing protein n=1 Tax=Paxillus rubicundulus Ve08.2h10 TaxID=930991 RepID=A0A0D0EB71_9AGAM|nr:hypothetical protein PAXRUDRAFT_7769 [Paxillus rubicundulus Ve08.2h10]